MFFFFNDTATTEIYTLSLHDALPIYAAGLSLQRGGRRAEGDHDEPELQDRKSTRLNSSHSQISYAVFCLKKKKQGDGHNALDTLASPSHTPTARLPGPRVLRRRLSAA